MAKLKLSGWVAKHEDVADADWTHKRRSSHY